MKYIKCVFKFMIKNLFLTRLQHKVKTLGYFLSAGENMDLLGSQKTKEEQKAKR